MSKRMTDEEFGGAAVALRKAIEEIGGITKTAQAIELTRQSVSAWTVCPAEWVLKISDLSGVACSELRPDLYRSE